MEVLLFGHVFLCSRMKVIPIPENTIIYKSFQIIKICRLLIFKGHQNNVKEVQIGKLKHEGIMLTILKQKCFELYAFRISDLYVPILATVILLYETLL